MSNQVENEISNSYQWTATRLRWRTGQWVNSIIRTNDVAQANCFFRQLPTPCLTTRKLFGYDMHLDLSRSSAQQLLYLMGERYIGERVLFKRLVRPGMTVVDVGANIGYHTLLFENLVGDGGKIIAIEPSPENLPELRANIHFNQLKNVRLEETAVGATQSSVHIRGGINSGVLNQGAGIATVPLVPLSDLTPDQVDFIKIDVDGYEADVVKGALSILKRDRPALLVEMHPHLLPRFNSSVSNVMAMLREVYSTFEVYDQLRASDEGMLQRVLRRYYDPGRLKRIHEFQPIIDSADARHHEWTFWVVCLP